MIDQLITSHWSSYGHRFIGTGDSDVQCLTCGALYGERIVDEDRCECDAPPCECGDPDRCTCGGCQCSTYVEGEYLNGYGSTMIRECSGDTGRAHGYERVCQNDNGNPCWEHAFNRLTLPELASIIGVHGMIDLRREVGRRLVRSDLRAPAWDVAHGWSGKPLPAETPETCPHMDHDCDCLLCY